MKILITGACGFVGTNLALHYLAKGAEVLALDNNYKQQGNHENMALLRNAGARFAYLDIRNSHDVEVLFRQEKGIDAVLHMAAQVAFKVSVQNPRVDFEINALGTFNLLEAVRVLHPAAIFLTASTNQVYGALPSDLFDEMEMRFDYKVPSLGIREVDPLDFLSPYGCSKGAADLYTLDYARIYGLRAVVARFGGIYGLHQYSYEDHGWVSYISDMVRRGASFNRFGHGKQVRDILFCSDIVDAVDLMVERIDLVKGRAINIAGGKNNSMSVLELLKLLEELTGKKECSMQLPMRTGDKLVAYLDISLAKSLLGWSPRVSKREGVERLLRWLGTRRD